MVDKIVKKYRHYGKSFLHNKIIKEESPMPKTFKLNKKLKLLTQEKHSQRFQHCFINKINI